jgi:hypothetical protein
VIPELKAPWEKPAPQVLPAIEVFRDLPAILGRRGRRDFRERKATRATKAIRATSVHRASLSKALREQTELRARAESLAFRSKARRATRATPASSG